MLPIFLLLIGVVLVVGRTARTERPDPTPPKFTPTLPRPRPRPRLDDNDHKVRVYTEALNELLRAKAHKDSLTDSGFIGPSNARLDEVDKRISDAMVNFKKASEALREK